MIPDSFKQDLLNRVDIVDVVSRYVQLRKAGANHLGLCPFHTEKTPSFTVSPSKQFYHCFGCGAHGNAIGFLMAYGGLGYVDAVKDLAGSVGLEVPAWQPSTPLEAARRERETSLTEIMETALGFYRAELKKSQRAIAYLKGRGLAGETAARYRIGYAPDDWQALRAAFPDYEAAALAECGLVIDNDGGKRYDRFRDRVVFPIFSARGAVIGFGGRVLGEGEPKYLNSPETPLFEKGRELYGLVQARDAIRTAGRALVVEGYMDVVMLAQHGVGYAVATLGTATTPVHVAKLLRLADEIVFCFDGDDAGRKAAWRALEVALPLAPEHKPMRFLFLPQGEDPDSYVRAHGREAIEALARRAPTLSEFLLAELRAQADLASPEGRSKFLAAARPYLQKVEAPALRVQLVKEVAALAGVSEEQAGAILQIGGAAAPFRQAAPARRQFQPPSSNEWKLLACVAAFPVLGAEVDAGLLDMKLPESRALGDIRAWLGGRDAAEPPGSAVLIDALGDGPHGELIAQAQAFAMDVYETEDQASRALQHLVWKLDILRKNLEIDDLTQKLKRGELSRDEHLRYGRMIAEVKALETRLQSSNP